MVETKQFKIIHFNPVFDSPLYRKGAYNVRYEVFSIGQNVDPNYERDDIDPKCHHWAIVDLEGTEEKVVGTARAYEISKEDAEYKISRIAVLSEYQGKGVGKQLMIQVEKDLKLLYEARSLYLEAQDDKIQFYTRLGYELIPDSSFMQQSISHVKMRKRY